MSQRNCYFSIIRVQFKWSYLQIERKLTVNRYDYERDFKVRDVRHNKI